MPDANRSEHRGACAIRIAMGSLQPARFISLEIPLIAFALKQAQAGCNFVPDNSKKLIIGEFHYIMKSRAFLKAPMAMGVALAVSSQTSVAQTEPNQISSNESASGMEEVIVTGIRQSLQKSADIKRS